MSARALFQAGLASADSGGHLGSREVWSSVLSLIYCTMRNFCTVIFLAGRFGILSYIFQFLADLAKPGAALQTPPSLNN